MPCVGAMVTGGELAEKRDGGRTEHDQVIAQTAMHGRTRVVEQAQHGLFLGGAEISLVHVEEAMRPARRCNSETDRPR